MLLSCVKHGCRENRFTAKNAENAAKKRERRKRLVVVRGQS
jgi:hypothetical protein